MRLLGLDVDTHKIAWSIFEDEEYVESGVFAPKASLAWQERIKHIAAWLNDFLAHRKPEAVAYEVASGNRGNMATHRKLGAVEWACWREGWFWAEDWIEVNVQHAKQTGCHKHAIVVAEGIAGKRIDHRYAEDEADAIGCALAALRKIKEESLCS